MAAESAVTSLLEKLKLLLHEEVDFLKGVQGDLEYLRDELERMRAILRAADVMEDSDLELNIWVKQVRNVAYEIEDVLDEFKLQQEQDHGEKFYGLLQQIFPMTKNKKARHQIASELQAIKSKVNSISDSYQRYNSNILEKGLSSAAANNTCFDLRGDAVLLEEAELVGINKPKNQLIDWLLEDNPRLKVISVVGMGGLGKTTLIKKVYDDAAVKKHFRNHAWINVSQGFKMEELLQDMIYQLFDGANKPAPQGMETMNSHRMKTIIKEFLMQSRYLLVLDDVWSISSWEAVKHIFPKSNCGSCVVLTTRDAEVAITSKESKGKVFKMEPLSPEESWTLFCRKTFHENICPPHLEKISQQILSRCEGLPLAIVAISGVLATKDRSRIDEWVNVVHNLGAEIGGNDTLQSMAKILLLGFGDLPYYLKSCFLYLSIFPDDHSIECMRLIRLWIAEGFVVGMEGKTLEEVAEAYLNELLSRSLIQAAETTSDGRVHSCRIHNLVRKIILSKLRDQNFAAIASEQYPIWPEKVRRLSIHNTLANVQQDKSLSQLRSLLMFGVVDSLSKASMCSLLSGGLRLLTVLDLTGSSLETVPGEFFSLYYLKYLSLRDTKVKTLPKSIGKLKNLEMLDLKRTNISELPSEVSKLLRLRHLLLYHYETESYVPYHYLNGFKAPVGIGRLQSLQKLCFIETNHGDGILEELGKLTKLRRLGITKLRKEDGMVFCSSIDKLSNLRSLNVHSMEEDEIIDMQHLSSPSQFLQRLYLHGRLEKLPHWITSLHSLVKLFLRWSQLRDDLLEPLGSLPNLVELQLRQAYDGEGLNFNAGSFQRLKILLLDELEELRWVNVEKEAAVSLQELTISHCQLLEKVPSGIEHLSQLKLIQFFDMPDELSKTVSPDEQDGDYWKVAHVPQVYFIKRKSSQWERSILSKGNVTNKAEASK